MPWKTYAYTRGVDCEQNDIQMYKSIYSVQECTNKCSKLNNAAGFAYNSVSKECWCKNNIYLNRAKPNLTCYEMYWENDPPPSFDSRARGIPYEMQPYASTALYYEDPPIVKVETAARTISDCNYSCIIDNKNDLADTLCAYTAFRSSTGTCEKLHVKNPVKGQIAPLRKYDGGPNFQLSIARKTN
jgi:hypothetical protein